MCRLSDAGDVIGQAARCLGDPHQRAKRQRAMRRGYRAPIEPFATGGLPAGFRAVTRRDFGMRAGGGAKQRRGEKCSHRVTCLCLGKSSRRVRSTR